MIILSNDNLREIKLRLSLKNDIADMFNDILLNNVLLQNCFIM